MRQTSVTIFLAECDNTRHKLPFFADAGSGVSELLEAARRASARTVNAFMTATYWEIGRRIVEFEQGDRIAPIMATQL